MMFSKLLKKPTLQVLCLWMLGCLQVSNAKAYSSSQPFYCSNKEKDPQVQIQMEKPLWETFKWIFKYNVVPVVLFFVLLQIAKAQELSWYADKKTKPSLPKHGFNLPSKKIFSPQQDVKNNNLGLLPTIPEARYETYVGELWSSGAYTDKSSVQTYIDSFEEEDTQQKPSFTQFIEQMTKAGNATIQHLPGGSTFFVMTSHYPMNRKESPFYDTLLPENLN